MDLTVQGRKWHVSCKRRSGNSCNSNVTVVRGSGNRWNRWLLPMVGEYFHLWRQQFLMLQIKDSTVIVIWKSGGFDWRELQATWILCATFWYFLDVLFSWAINVWHPYATLCHPLPPWATLSHLVDNPRHLPRWEQPPVLSHLSSKKPNWHQLTWKWTLWPQSLSSVISPLHWAAAGVGGEMKKAWKQENCAELLVECSRMQKSKVVHRILQ